jgi:transposase
VRLMPPAYVKPYVKRQKNDVADAEAICEAVQRPSMRFVPVKMPDQQACLMLHRTRHLFIRQQTAVINSIRAHLAEFGIVARVGRGGVKELLDIVANTEAGRIPDLARQCVQALGLQLQQLRMQILALDRKPVLSASLVLVVVTALLNGAGEGRRCSSARQTLLNASSGSTNSLFSRSFCKSGEVLFGQEYVAKIV